MTPVTTLVKEYTFVMRVADSMVSLKATTRTVYRYLRAERSAGSWRSTEHYVLSLMIKEKGQGQQGMQRKRQDANLKVPSYNEGSDSSLDA